MNPIDTTLTTSGNSTAVVLPKILLRMSGLGTQVTLEAKKGKIIISQSNRPRQDWSTQIKQLVETHGDPACEFLAMPTAGDDSWDDLPWDGPAFEDWQQAKGRRGQVS